MLVELIISEIFPSILTWHLEHQLRACEKKSIDGRLVVIRHHPGSEQRSTIVTVQGGCQAARGIDSVEDLSWGRREGGELP